MLIEVPASGAGTGGNADTVLLYGHLDKQPEMVGWAEGYGPWMPRIDGDKLYGRGGADDGYAMFGALTALLGLRDQQAPHARCVIVIEACEESGSYDLPHYIEHLADRIGRPSLVICLDSGCGNYDQLWMTTSLRGIAAGTLTIEVLTEGVHSGLASGVVPSSFRILRALLSRLEDETSGAIRRPELYVQVPPERIEQARVAAAALGEAVYTEYPFAPGVRPMGDDLAELVLNRTWRPQLAVTGIDGLPKPGDAGNVLLPYTTAKLSLRSAADTRRQSRRIDAEKPVRERPALRRAYTLRVGRGRRQDGMRRRSRRWLEASLSARLGGRVRDAAGLYGRGRQHPVHGDARREIPGGAVCRDRRPRAAFERARTQRIFARADRAADHPGHRAGPSRSRHTRGLTGFISYECGLVRHHGAFTGATYLSDRSGVPILGNATGRTRAPRYGVSGRAFA